jgi:hypothetical protein
MDLAYGSSGKGSTKYTAAAEMKSPAAAISWSRTTICGRGGDL